MNKLIYICSLSHSGSTLLDLLLGNHPEIVSLGEITNSIKSYNKQQNMCTCGKHALECKIWGPVLQDLKDNQEDDLLCAYDKVLQKTEEMQGPNNWIVDSSKNLQDLLKIIALKKYDIRVIFLVKDIRSYLASMNKRYKRLREKDKLRNLINKLNSCNAYYWYRSNKKIKKAISELDIDCFQLGYEELCLNPHDILHKLCNWLDIEFDDSMLTPKGAKSHIIKGNAMRYKEEKLKSITYDFAWFNKKNLFPYHLIFSRLNSKLVYSNHL